MVLPDQRVSRFPFRYIISLISIGLAGFLVFTGCSVTGTGAETEKDTALNVSYQPGDGATTVNPREKISVSVGNDVLSDVVLTSSSGRAVKGKYDAGRHVWTASEVLGYNRSYSWKGTATGKTPRGNDKNPVELSGSFTTVKPSGVVNAQTYIGDDQTVGVATPIIVQFDGPVKNKAAVERALKVTADKAVEGSWAWLTPTEQGDRVHYRTKEYWPGYTTVNLKAKLYGIDYGDGMFGAKDFSLHFKIGRSQIVKANVPSHRMQVYRDGKLTMDIPASYGEGNESRNVTRSGVHVVSAMSRVVYMTNPPFYSNVPEYFAVRMSNNGEFIHANPQTVGNQGNSNVSNGCVNLSTANAEQYFNSALYGDPVDVTGTSIRLSEADGDIWDWAASWEDWKSWSALKGEGKLTGVDRSESATATTSAKTSSSPSTSTSTGSAVTESSDASVSDETSEKTSPAESADTAESAA